MPDFNNMTLVAAAQMLDHSHAHADLDLLELEWGIQGRCRSSSKSARLSDLAQIAIMEDFEVMTIAGRTPLARALVNLVASSDTGSQERGAQVWGKFLAGLKMDGFEIIQVPFESGENPFTGEPTFSSRSELRKMLPEDVPETDFREAESELNYLLDALGFSTTSGHLSQAITNFSQSSWAGANAQFRTFFESLIKEVAIGLGYTGTEDHRARVRHLGELNPPFLLADYNEWKSNDNAPQYVHGLMARMHPQGSHPGLSEEEDCTFRFQIALITARLLLRRFSQRIT